MGDSKDNKFINMMIVLAIVAGILFVVLEDKPEDYTPFSIEGFYSGTKGDVQDPRQTYLSYVSTDDYISSCNESPQVSDNGTLTASGAVWIIDSQTLDSSVNIKRSEDDNLSIIPFEEGEYILAPSNAFFLNANTLQASKDSITIKISLPGSYIMEFIDVYGWFCHMESEEQNHTKTLGYGGEACEDVTSSTIIGKAKSTTSVRLYKKTNGVEQQIDTLEYFLGSN